MQLWASGGSRVPPVVRVIQAGSRCGCMRHPRVGADARGGARVSFLKEE